MIFLSYAWSHSPSAHRLYESLVATGQDVWIDFERLDLNQPLEPQIREALLLADRLILLDSEESRCSRWVRYEVSLAIQLGTAIASVSPEVPTGYCDHSREQWCIMEGIANKWLHLTGDPLTLLTGR